MTRDTARAFNVAVAGLVLATSTPALAVESAAAQVDLYINSYVQTTAAAGSTFDQSVLVANHGPDTAGPVTLRLTSPTPGVVYTPAAGSPCTTDGATMVCSWGEGLAVNEGREVFLRVTAPELPAGVAEGQIDHEMTATTADATAVDVDPSNDVTRWATYTYAPASDLTAHVQGVPTSSTGQQAEFWVGVSNAGRDAGTAVVEVPLPAGARVAHAGGATVGGGVLRWVEHVEAGAPLRLSPFRLVFSEGGPVRLRATVTAPSREMTPEDNVATHDVDVRLAARVVDVGLTTARAVQTSDLVVADVRVHDDTGGAAPGVDVTVRVPARSAADGYRYLRGVTNVNGHYTTASRTDEVPIRRSVVTASTAASARYRAGATSWTTSVIPEDMTAQVISKRAARNRAVRVNAVATESSALSYRGVRKETSRTTRSDVRRARVLTTVFAPGRCGTGRPLLRSTAAVVDAGTLGDGVGLASVTFTPRTAGSYCVVATTGIGSWHTMPKHVGYISVG